jgi:hypothetical protein
MLENSWVTAQLAACQEELSYIQLASQLVTIIITFIYLAMRDMRIPDKFIRLTELRVANNCAMVKVSNVLSTV